MVDTSFRRLLTLLLVGGGFTFAACGGGPSQSPIDAAPGSVVTAPSPVDAAPQRAPASSCDGGSQSVLVDASHDGGVWWFPQAGPFNPDEYHQGQELAWYFRSRRYRVDEIGRGEMVTRALLRSYRIVIRAGSFGPYNLSEIAAYVDFVSSPHVGSVSCPRTLILFSEFLRPGEEDRLAKEVGIHLTGTVRGHVTDFVEHPITAGMTYLGYVAGSFLVQERSSNVQILARLATGEPIMGIINREPNSRIFFIGDTNGIESVPQPLVDNLIAWGF